MKDANSRRIPEMLKERAPNYLRRVEKNLSCLDGGLVGVDIDGVIQASYVNALHKVSHHLRAAVSKHQLITYWELVKIVSDHGIEGSMALKFAKDAWNERSVFLNSPLMPGASTLLETLHEIQVPHIIVSSRPPEFLDETMEWFDSNFPWIKADNIVLGRDKGMTGGEFKRSVVEKFGIKVHIEDAYEEALEIANKTPARVLLVPQPWNANEHINHPRIKFLGPYDDNVGVWPVMRFLASSEAWSFLRGD